MRMDWIPAPLAPRDGADREAAGLLACCHHRTLGDGVRWEAATACEGLGWRTVMRDGAGDGRAGHDESTTDDARVCPRTLPPGPSLRAAAPAASTVGPTSPTTCPAVPCAASVLQKHHS